MKNAQTLRGRHFAGARTLVLIALGLFGSACTEGRTSNSANDDDDGMTPGDKPDDRMNEEPREPQTLSNSEPGPTGLAVDGNIVVWTNEGQGADFPGTVAACYDLECLGGARAILDGLRKPHLPVLRDTTLHFINAWSQETTVPQGFMPVMASLASEPVEIDPFSFPPYVPFRDTTAMAIADDRVYFAMDRLSGPAVGASIFSCGIAFCDTIERLPEEELATKLPFISALSVDESSLYAASVDGILHKIDRQSFERTELASAQIGVFNLARMDDQLVWGTSIPEDLDPDVEVSNYVASVSTLGGTPRKLADTGEVTALSVHDDFVYFGDAGGRIARVHRDGGDIQVLLEGRMRPSGLAISAGYLYWSEYGFPGSIHRLLLPEADR